MYNYVVHKPYIYILFVFFNETPEVAIVDFEFTQLGKNNLILISGTILGRFRPEVITKLEGRALKLNTNKPVNDTE